MRNVSECKRHKWVLVQSFYAPFPRRNGIGSDYKRPCEWRKCSVCGETSTRWVKAILEKDKP